MTAMTKLGPPRRRALPSPTWFWVCGLSLYASPHHEALRQRADQAPRNGGCGRPARGQSRCGGQMPGEPGSWRGFKAIPVGGLAA